MSSHAHLLSTIGARLRAARVDRGMTQAALARRAGVSPRFLVQLEKGEGNISVARLADVCAALGLRLDGLFSGLGPGGGDKVVLVGMRGAGKSTVGRALANRGDAAFVELDRLVEERAGMSLPEIFELRGEAHYRLLEGELVEEVLSAPGRAVLAAGGGIVTDAGNWARVRARARTVWLQASPAAHLERVMAQGDLRPMRGRPNALAELREILAERAPMYGLAQLSLDTEAVGVEGAVEHLAAWAW